MSTKDEPFSISMTKPVIVCSSVFFFHWILFTLEYDRSIYYPIMQIVSMVKMCSWITLMVWNSMKSRQNSKQAQTGQERVNHFFFSIIGTSVLVLKWTQVVVCVQCRLVSWHPTIALFSTWCLLDAFFKQNKPGVSSHSVFCIASYSSFPCHSYLKLKSQTRERWSEG